MRTGRVNATAPAPMRIAVPAVRAEPDIHPPASITATRLPTATKVGAAKVVQTSTIVRTPDGTVSVFSHFFLAYNVHYNVRYIF
jgi:hypothetical protein